MRKFAGATYNADAKSADAIGCESASCARAQERADACAAVDARYSSNAVGFLILAFAALIIIAGIGFADDSIPVSPGSFNSNDASGAICLANMNATGIDAVLDPANGRISLFLYTTDENYTKSAISRGGIFVYKILTDASASGSTIVTASRVTADAGGRAYVGYDPSLPLDGCVAYTFTYCPLPYTHDAMNACFKVPNNYLTGGFQDIWCSDPSCGTIACNSATDGYCTYVPLQNTGNLPSQATVTYCNRARANLTDLCWPLMIILGLLMGAMFAAGHNPFAAFDFSTPRLSRGRQYQMRPKSVSIDVTSIAMGANRLTSVGGAALGAGKSGGTAQKNADGTITLKDKNGKVVGGVDKKGVMTDAKGNVIGKVQGGKVYDMRGNKIGTVNPGGKFSLNGKFAGGKFAAGLVAGKDLKSRLGGNFERTNPGLLSRAGASAGSALGKGMEKGINAVGLGGVGASIRKGIGSMFEKRGKADAGGKELDKSADSGKANLAQGVQMSGGSRLAGMQGKKPNAYSQYNKEQRQQIAGMMLDKKEGGSGGRLGEGGRAGLFSFGRGGSKAADRTAPPERILMGGSMAGAGGGFGMMPPGDITSPISKTIGILQGKDDAHSAALKSALDANSVNRGWAGVFGVYKTVGSDLLQNFGKSTFNNAIMFTLPYLVLRGKLKLGPVSGITEFGAKAMLFSEYGGMMWLPPGMSEIFSGAQSGLKAGLFTPADAENKANKCFGGQGGETDDYRKIAGQLNSTGYGISSTQEKIESKQKELEGAADPEKKAAIRKEMEKLEGEKLLLERRRDELEGRLAQTPRTERLAVWENKDGTRAVTFVTDRLEADGTKKTELVRAAKPAEISEIASSVVASARRDAEALSGAEKSYDRLQNYQAALDGVNGALLDLGSGKLADAQKFIISKGLVETDKSGKPVQTLTAGQMSEILQAQRDGNEKKMGSNVLGALDMIGRIEALGNIPSPQAAQMAEDMKKQVQELMKKEGIWAKGSETMPLADMKEKLQARMMDKYTWALDATRVDSKMQMAETSARMAEIMDGFTGKGDWWLTGMLGARKSDITSVLKYSNDESLAQKAFERNTDQKMEDYGAAAHNARELADVLKDEGMKDYAKYSVRLDELGMRIEIAQAHGENTAKLEAERQELKGRLSQIPSIDARIEELDRRIAEAGGTAAPKELVGQRNAFAKLAERLEDVNLKHQDIVDARTMDPGAQVQSGSRIIREDVDARLSLLDLYGSAHNFAEQANLQMGMVGVCKSMGYGTELFYMNKEERKAEYDKLLKEQEDYRQAKDEENLEKAGAKLSLISMVDAQFALFGEPPLDRGALQAGHDIIAAQRAAGGEPGVAMPRGADELETGQIPQSYGKNMESFDYRTSVMNLMMGMESGKVDELRSKGGYGMWMGLSTLQFNAADALKIGYENGTLNGAAVAINSQRIGEGLMHRIEASPAEFSNGSADLGIAASQFRIAANVLAAADPATMSKATTGDRELFGAAITSAIDYTAQGITQGGLTGKELLMLGGAASREASGFGSYLGNSIKINGVSYEQKNYSEQVEQQTFQRLQKIEELAQQVNDNRQGEALAGRKEAAAPAEQYGPPAPVPQQPGDYIHAAIEAISHMPMIKEERQTIDPAWLHKADEAVTAGSPKYDEKLHAEFEWLKNEGGKSEEQSKLAIGEYLESTQSADRMIEKKTSGHPELLSDEDRSQAIVAIAFRGAGGGAREVASSLEATDDGKLRINDDELIRRTMGSRGMNYLSEHLDSYRAAVAATTPPPAELAPMPKAAAPSEPQEITIGNLQLEWRIQAVAAQSQVDQLSALAARMQYDIDSEYFKKEQLQGAQEMLAEVNRKLYGSDGNGGYHALAEMAAQTIDYVQTEKFQKSADSQERLAELATKIDTQQTDGIDKSHYGAFGSLYDNAQTGLEVIIAHAGSAIDNAESSYNMAISSQPKTAFRDWNVPGEAVPEFSWMAGGHGMAAGGAEALRSPDEDVLLEQVRRYSWSSPGQVEDPIAKFGMAVHAASVAPVMHGLVDYMPKDKEFLWNAADYQASHMRATGQRDDELMKALQQGQNAVLDKPLESYKAAAERTDYQSELDDYMKKMRIVDAQEKQKKIEQEDAEKRREELHQGLNATREEFKMRIVMPGAGREDLKPAA